MAKLKLSIEMVPASSWHNNLRGLLKPKMWDEIRKKVYAKYSNRCSICKSNTKKLHAHEEWEYDETQKIQKLKDIIPLCYYCHGVKHFGYTTLVSPVAKEKFIKHFMKINNCDRLAFQTHLNNENEKFKERSKYEWQLDLEKLRDF